MADNFNFTDGTNDYIGAADDIGGGVLAQRTKPVYGSDGSGVDVSIQTPLPVIISRDVEYVAAGQTNQVLGNTGGAGDYLYGLLVVPETTSPGSISVKDGSGTAREVFNGGTGSVGSKVPFFIPLNWFSVTGAWSVTTGGNVHVFGQGNFTA